MMMCIDLKNRVFTEIHKPLELISLTGQFEIINKILSGFLQFKKYIHQINKLNRRGINRQLTLIVGSFHCIDLEPLILKYTLSTRELLPMISTHPIRPLKCSNKFLPNSVSFSTPGSLGRISESCWKSAQR